MSNYIDVKLNPADVLTDREFEALAEAICEHLSDKTGFCVEGLSIGFDVTYLPERMDCEEDALDTYEIEEIEDALDISLANLNREAVNPIPHEKHLVERALTIIRGKAKAKGDQ